MAYEHISVPVTETITAPAVILVGEQGPTLEQIDSRKKNIRRILNQARNHQVKDLFDPRDYEINPDHQDLRVTGEMEVLPGRGYLYTQATVGVPLETLHIALDTITRAAMQDWLAAALASEPRTVILVTHDVEEAIVLADRVVVMSPRPGHAVATIEVDLPRPRDRTSPEVVELRRHALEALS